MEEKNKVIGRLPLSLKEKIITRYEKTFISSKKGKIEAFFIDYSSFNVYKGDDVKLFLNRQGQVDSIACKLLFITNEMLLSLDLVEIGYKSICFLEFEKEIKFIELIPVVENWYEQRDKNYYDNVFLMLG